MLHSPLVSSVLNTNNIPKNVTSNILAKFSKLICEIQSSNARNVNPNKLKEAINKTVPQFADFDQHDAQEFLTFLLSTLNEEMKELINENTKEPFIHKLMYGSIQSTCTCQKCKNTSTLEEEFSTLNLPLPQSVNN
jgi:ubiquitin C-terminal hydrolase